MKWETVLMFVYDERKNQVFSFFFSLPLLVITTLYFGLLCTFRMSIKRINPVCLKFKFNNVLWLQAATHNKQSFFYLLCFGRKKISKDSNGEWQMHLKKSSLRWVQQKWISGRRIFSHFPEYFMRKLATIVS